MRILNDCMKILRRTKATSTLQKRISTYVDILRTRLEICEKTCQNLNEIYNEVIKKVAKYSDGTNIRIRELFEKNRLRFR